MKVFLRFVLTFLFSPLQINIFWPILGTRIDVDFLPFIAAQTIIFMIGEGLAGNARRSCSTTATHHFVTPSRELLEFGRVDFRILRGAPYYPLRTQRDIIIACAIIHNFLMMSSDVEVSLIAEEDDHDEDDMEQVGDNIEQDGAPSNQQDEGHQTAMGKFRDVVTESMWTYRNQN